MKKKHIITIIVCIAAVVAITLFVRHLRQAEAASYQTAEVTRGDIENTVSSTGTLSAVQTVSVGSQVSGIIDRLYVDFNDNVKKGQVLAVLDTTILAAQVFDAKATQEKSQSQLAQAQSEYDRNKPLFDSGFLSETEWLGIKTSYDAARASFESANAALKRAKTNLAYSTITSPIDGTVIERNVDAGQTIASSFQAPTLFIIAKDLSKMEIDVNVDESDIGSIKTGLPVKFTVQAYPDDTFRGTVRQVRLQPTTIQNVVNYTVVVDATNDRGLLLPGMTATVDFIIHQSKNALMVPNAALVFRPTAELLAKFKDRMPQMAGGSAWRRTGGAQAAARRMYAQSSGGQGQMGMQGTAGQVGMQGMGGDRRGMDRMHMVAVNDSGSARRHWARGDSTWARRHWAHRDSTGAGPGAWAAGRDSSDAGEQAASTGEEAPSRIFYLDDKGEVQMALVTTGITDGRNTEILGKSPLPEGTQVIIGVNKSSKTGQGQSSSRFSLNPRPQFGPRSSGGQRSGGGGPH